MNAMGFKGNIEQDFRYMPVQIKVNVVVKSQKNNLNLQISIDPEMPFYLFIDGIKDQIFAKIVQAQYEETIECQLENGINIPPTEKRNLSQLGFSNSCTLNVRLKLKANISNIQLSVIFQIEKESIKLQVSVDPEIPFQVLMDGIYHQAFSEELYSKYQGQFEYLLDNIIPIDKNENRSLNQLGNVHNESTLYAIYKQNKPKQVLKVTVKYCLPQELNLQMNDIVQDVKNKLFQEDVDIYDCNISVKMKYDGQ